MKAFLWSLCVHLVLLGLLTYHHFAPTEAIKLKPEPPILAYAYQPVRAKPAAVVTTPVAASAKEIAPKAAVRPVKKAPVKSSVKKAVAKKPVVKRPPVKPKPKAAAVRSQTTAVKPARKPFVPVRKPAMVKPQPAAVKPPSRQQTQKPVEVAAATVVAQAVSVPPVVVAAKVQATLAEVKEMPQTVPVKPAIVTAKALPEPPPKPAKVQVVQPEPVVKPAAVRADPKSAQIAATADRRKIDVTAASNTVFAGPQQGKSIATNVLQKARQGDASGSASWKEKQQQLALEITRVKPEQKPEVGRKVKTFADGSSLIDTNPGCWKVPPPESRKNSIWLASSVPCKPDTTAEQIDAILQKRRSYSRD